MAYRQRLPEVSAHPGGAWTRRRAMLAGVAGLGCAGLPVSALADPPAGIGYDGVGRAEAEHQSRLVNTWWENLPRDPAEHWQLFERDAVHCAKELELATPVIDKYLGLASEMRAGGVANGLDPAVASEGPREITLLPKRVEAVPVAIAKMSNAVSTTSRFVMPFLSATPIGPAAAGAFAVLDVTFKAAAWLSSSHLFQGRDRAFANPRLIPVSEAHGTVWRSPASGRKVEGAMHPAVIGQVFIGRDFVVDEVTGLVGQVIGLRKSGEIADEGTVRMFLVKLLEG